MSPVRVPSGGTSLATPVGGPAAAGLGPTALCAEPLPPEQPAGPAPFTVARDGAVATVTLHGTATGNALGGAAWAELPRLFDALAADVALGAVVLRGAGDMFSCGLDLRWYLPTYRRSLRLGDGQAAARRDLLKQTLRLQEAISAVAECPLPVVAAVSGPCLGAGLELAAACDIRLADAGASFAAREVSIDVVPDLGLLQRLPSLVGDAWTRYLVMSGDTVGANLAERIGLVTQVLPEPEDLFMAAADLASRIAGHQRHVLAGIKTVLADTRDMPRPQALHHSAVWTAAFLPTSSFQGKLREALGQASPACALPSRQTAQPRGE